MQEIPISDIKTIKIGQVENTAAGTGCTVFICPDGMAAGVDVRGGGPASRETTLLSPLTAASEIHAVVLSGGSAFGLAASEGVMAYLEEHDIGYDVGVTKVPLVVQSNLFDLTVGSKDVRPDYDMGYQAAKCAFETPNYQDGNYGAGCGATVGKLKGMATCMKTGIGSCAVKVGSLIVGAVVALNALGDVYDVTTGKKIAGLLKEDLSGFCDSMEVMLESIAVKENKFVDNTTLGVVITNAAFSKTQLCKIAGMAQNGYARAINPVHTSADGDSIYALSIGDVEADMDLVGTLAARVISLAIKRAVFAAKSDYGYMCANDLEKRGHNL